MNIKPKLIDLERMKEMAANMDMVDMKGVKLNLNMGDTKFTMGDWKGFNMDWMNKKRPQSTSSVSSNAEDWSGKGAAVLGANSEVGVAVIEKLLNLKMKVIALDSESTLLEELKSNKELHRRFHYIKKNFKTENDVTDAFEIIVEKIGGASVLVNNLYSLPNYTLLESDTSDFRKSAIQNVLQPITCTREFIKSAKDHYISLGHIINISSIFANRTPKKSSLHAFAGLKAADQRLHVHLRHELEYNNTDVKVTNICPEFIIPTFQEYVKENEAIKPNDIADAIEYVLNTSSHTQVREIWLQNSMN